MSCEEHLSKQRKKINKLFEELGLEYVKNPSRYLATATVKEYDQISRVIDEIIERYPGKDIYYRGQEKQLVPIPSIVRGGRGKTRRSEYLNNLFSKEYEFISEFKKVCQDKGYPYTDTDCLSFLAICQHHGVPTRLLDVTKNKDIALFFATEQQEKTMGCLYIFIQGNYAESALLQMFLLDQAKMLHQQKSMKFSEMIDLFIENHPEQEIDKMKFSQIIQDHYNRRALLHIDAPASFADDRLENQQGSFMLFGNALWGFPSYEYRFENYGIDTRENTFIANEIHREKMYGVIKLRIPYECKKSILQRVMQKGITWEYVYPSFESCAKSFVKKFEYKLNL